VAVDPNRVLVEYATDVAYITTIDGEVEWVSPAVTRVLGFAGDALIGTRLRDLVHPDDRDIAYSWRERVVAEGAPTAGATSEPVRIRRADGSHIWCAVTVVRVLDDAGRWVGLTGSIHDVDALVRTRLDLAEAHAALHAVLEAQVDPMATLVAVRDDAGAVIDFRYEDANEAAARYHQRAVTDLLGATVMEVLGPGVGEVDVAAAEGVLRTGQAVVLNDQWSKVRERQGCGPTYLDIRIVPVDEERVSYSWRDVTDRFTARQAVARAHDLLRSVIDAQVDPHVLLRAVRDEGGAIVDFVYEDCNAAACAFEGWERVDLIGSTMRAVYPSPQEAVEDIADCTQALLTRAPVVRNDSRTLGYFDGQGRPVVVDIRVVPIDEDLVSYTWRDVTERHLAQAALAASEERLRLLAENMTDIVVLIRDQIVTWISPSVTRTLGWRPHEIVGQSPRMFTDPRDVDQVIARWVAIPQGALPRQRYRLVTRDGDIHWVDAEGSVVGTDGARTVVVTARVVDAEVEALSALEEMARHDELTGLVNRHAVFSQLRRSLGDDERSGTRVGLVFCDLDGFKAVNDEYGHTAGDALLRAVARRLEAEVRSGDVVARIGGDEMLVVLNGVRGLDDAVRIAEKLGAAIRQPTDIPGGTVQVSASMGVTLAAPGEDVDAIVARADAAMYEAKRQGKDAVVAVAD
jgi:diguanylate cyclase (GGDEF)-like protein/PAS domain S-box-containing protein